MPSLYVIRHGEPLLKGVLLGHSDPALSEAGLAQASRLAVELPKCAVYSSPLRRAYQTACFLDDHPIILPDLAEISYGEWDGLRWIDIEQQWPVLSRDKLADWEGVAPPGGEEWQTFLRRVGNALTRITTGPLPAALVAHEAVNAAIAQKFTGVAIQSYKQQYCEVIQYELRSGC